MIKKKKYDDTDKILHIWRNGNLYLVFWVLPVLEPFTDSGF